MPSEISPYALLRASRPKHPNAVTSQYDLFSLAQSASTFADTGAPPGKPVPDVAPASVPPPAPAPMQRTHYICDIHARHANASRRTPQSSSSL